MWNIIAINNSSKKELICENFVKNKKRALDYWSTQGMTNCIYKAIKASVHDNININKRNH